MSNSFNSFADALCQVDSRCLNSFHFLVQMEDEECTQWSQMLSYIHDKLFIVSFCYDVAELRVLECESSVSEWEGKVGKYIICERRRKRRMAIAAGSATV